MNQNYSTYEKAFKKVREHFKTLNLNEDGTFTINNQIIKLLTSLPVYNQLDGSKNGLKLNGIGKFNFKIDQHINTYIFPIHNQQSNKVELVIIPRTDLINRICDLNTTNGIDISIRFWITEMGIYETQGIGVEFEFMGLWLDQKRNYSAYLQ